MWDYTDKVLEHFYSPKNQGAIEAAEEPGVAVVFGEVGSIACGDALRLHLKIEAASDTILDARFQTFGCTSAIASSSALTEIVKGKTLDQALQITNHDIAEFLGGLPEAKMHCSVMGQEALEAAIYKYRGIPLESHDEDEGALICRCFGITDTKIRRMIIENDLVTAEQVTNYVKAGGGCGSCLVIIDDLIARVQQERETLSTKVTSELSTVDNSSTWTTPAPATQSTATAAKPLTTVQKIALIQKVLDEEIRPVLMADGGDVELYDIQGDRIQVVLKGACGGCPSSTDTLKYAIEARLKERISPQVIVEAV